jgi:hypothetical protein
MTPRTLRRKLQKKAKRRRYTRCFCGGQMVGRAEAAAVVCRCNSCGTVKTLAWTGGGIGRRIPPDGGERPGEGRARSSRAPSNDATPIVWFIGRDGTRHAYYEVRPDVYYPLGVTPAP